MPFLAQGKTNWKYLVIVITLALAISVIWAYQYWWLPKHEIKPPEITIKDETADWTIYRNENYGFEFKYPQDWGNPNTFLRSAPSDIQGQDINIFEIEGFHPGTRVSPFLEYFPIHSKTTLSNFIKGTWLHSATDIPEKIFVDGMEATKFSLETKYNGKGEYDPAWNIQVGFQDKKGGLFVINYGCPIQDKEQGISLFNNLISTFKFTQ